MCLMMKWDGSEWKTDEKTFLDVTDIYLIIKYTYWHITFGVMFSSYNILTKTLAGVIFGIYMEFALKWDQTMLCLDIFFIS